MLKMLTHGALTVSAKVISQMRKVVIGCMSDLSDHLIVLALGQCSYEKGYLIYRSSSRDFVRHRPTEE